MSDETVPTHTEHPVNENEPVVDTTNTSGIIKVAQTILTTSGPVALLALALTGFLMYFMLNQMTAVTKAVETNHGEILQAKIDMGKYVARQAQIDELRSEQMSLLIRISQQMCLNSAKTDSAIAGCLAK